MGAGLDGVGLEVAVHAEALAGGAEPGEQDDGEGIEQQQSVAPLRVADANRREAQAEAQVLGISETGLHSPPFRVQRDDLRRGRVTIAGHQGSFMSLACTHTTAPTGHCAPVTVASRSLRARPPWPSAAGQVVPSAAPTLVLPFSRMT